MRTKAQHERIYRGVPQFLRRLREEAGLTQRQLGAILGKRQAWVYGSETGNRRVDVAEFSHWCRACNMEPATAIRRLEREPQ